MMNLGKLAQPTANRSWIITLLRQRSVQLALSAWILVTVLIFVLSQGTLPFDRPVVASVPFIAQVIGQQVQLVVALLLVGVAYVVTRRRVLPDMASRAPAHALALTETAAVLVYGAVVVGMGQVVGHIIGTHGIGLHLHGTIYGATQPVTPGETLWWAAYNFVFLAVLPYVVFRARGYSRQALNLTSSNVRADILLILVILVLESLLDFSISSIFSLTSTQLLLGGFLSFIIQWS
jgi:hypothetical protein